MPECVPRSVLGTVLDYPSSAMVVSQVKMLRTMFEETAPFRFPQLMSMPVATPRLYDPSKLLDIHAMTFGTQG